MNEARPRQRERDQPNEAEIAEHFVDDATRRRRGGANALDIIRPESRELLVRNPQDGFRVNERFGHSAAEPRHLPAKIADFPRAVDVTMAGEYLLDQSRAGTRHADNEYGDLGRVPLEAVGVHDLLHMIGARTRQSFEHGCFIIWKFSALAGVADR